MPLRFFNGLQIDAPADWTDLSTVILAPRKEVEEGRTPGINLVVKRRPTQAKDPRVAADEYLRYMQQAFGTLEDVQSREMLVGTVRGLAIRFVATAQSQRFRQVTLIYVVNGEEISATVTQRMDDPTPMQAIERLLRSIRPAASGIHGMK